MQLHTAGLLLIAALAQSTSGAVLWEILNRRAPEHLPPNATTIATPAEGATHSLTASMHRQDGSSISSTSSSLTLTSISINETSSSPPVSNQPEQSSSSIATSDPISTAAAVNHDTSLAFSRSQADPPSSSSLSTSLDSLTASLAIPDSQFATTSTTINSTLTEEENGRTISANQERPPSTTVLGTTPRANTTREVDSTIIPSHNGSISSTTPSWNGTQSYYSTTRPTTSGPQSDTCTDLQGDEPVTVYSIVFTATVTIYGNRSDYTPPYPTIETPNYCGTASSAPPLATRTNEPFISSMGGFITATKEPPLPLPTCSGPSQSDCFAAAKPGDSESSDVEKGKHGGQTQSSRRVTVTFITTDKNPSAVFPSDPVPRFGQSGNVPGITAQQHKSAPATGDGQDDPQDDHKEASQDNAHGGPQSLEQEPQTTFVITAKAGDVIINGETFSSLQPDQTTTVTVSRGIFTIYPTAVVGEGATVEKPQPVGTAVTALTPTTGSAGGLSVTVSGSDVVVDGTRMEIPPLGTTTTVSGEAVSIGPGKVVVDGDTITFRAVGGYQTDVVVTGGEMFTAVGQSIFVFHSTTLTYGPGIPEASEVVDDDTITIGPSGVIVDGTTIGGTSADATDTTYEIVGGATITKVSPSFAIIDGTTFTIGPKASKVTKVIGGETITIGPSGVVISTMTLNYPFGSSVVTTIEASATGSDTVPVETERSKMGNDGDEGNAGYLLQPSLAAGMTGLCIAIGVWLWL
ncbi:hypothetical protein BGZ61DRAFT_526643 [Ilyonectria robusta]|uniref:uncharacterized protein n=1 Tax=Ilyonectria robusta TaxID=1079257 RepID=UPI001E8D36CD|nr:uncharacterized protein BGZ61DRAFT_526643 [Ilyonectria robusta]KAH8735581.1 hypothetical protein BGZ61DRAFT_526643 [Ilyonectria robusta]